MKKLILIPFVLLAFVLCGCSVSLDLDNDPDLSKVDQFTAMADEIDAVFTEAKSAFTASPQKHHFY
ncbi:MAG TPA: hypothetical protein VNS08_11260 [Ureibacillus sp.]|nr:hypothetical protein [Ureibacillus sp.]